MGFWGFGEQYVTGFYDVLRSVTYCSPKPQNPVIKFDKLSINNF